VAAKKAAALKVEALKAVREGRGSGARGGEAGGGGARGGSGGGRESKAVTLTARRC
jgi:hypothetical protein